MTNVHCIIYWTEIHSVLLFFCHVDTPLSIIWWWKTNYSLNSCDELFRFDGDSLTIRRGGLYFLYSQVNVNENLPPTMDNDKVDRPSDR